MRQLTKVEIERIKLLTEKSVEVTLIEEGIVVGLMEKG